MGDVEDWHGKAGDSVWRQFQAFNGYMSSHGWIPDPEVGEAAGRIIRGDRLGIGRTEGGMVTLTIGAGDDKMKMVCSPARARQIAAALLNKADEVE